MIEKWNLYFLLSMSEKVQKAVKKLHTDFCNDLARLRQQDLVT